MYVYFEVYTIKLFYCKLTASARYLLTYLLTYMYILRYTLLSCSAAS